MASWFEENIGRPVKDFLKGERAVVQDEIKVSNENTEKVVHIDDRGREYIWKNGQIYDPLAKAWFDESAFYYLFNPAAVYQSSPDVPPVENFYSSSYFMKRKERFDELLALTEDPGIALGVLDAEEDKARAEIIESDSSTVPDNRFLFLIMAGIILMVILK